jgi:serine/threonine protein kinase
MAKFLTHMFASESSFSSQNSDAALATLQSIHRINILHDDIQPENILVSKSGITIIDFD